MSRRFILPILFLLFVAQTIGAGDEAAKDRKLLEGKWIMVGLEVNGQLVPPAKLEGTTLIIKGDTYTVRVKDRITQNCKLTLDPKQKPSHMDMIFLDGEKKDRSHKAIYKIDGDKLQIARGLNADQNRPDQFATWPDTNYFVVTWQRAGE